MSRVTLKPKCKPSFECGDLVLDEIGNIIMITDDFNESICRDDDELVGVTLHSPDNDLLIGELCVIPIGKCFPYHGDITIHSN